MAVQRKVQVLVINMGLKIVKQLGDVKRRMLMRKFKLQHHVPMYVGEEEKLHGVPVKYFSSIMLKAILKTFEAQIQDSTGPIKLSCSEEMFNSIMDLVKDENRSDMDKGVGSCGLDVQEFDRFSSIHLG